MIAARGFDSSIGSSAAVRRIGPRLGPGQLTDPNALPLKDFISETMNILKHSSEVTEICVERVEPLRRAEASGNYDTFYKTFNDRAASAHETL